MVPQQADLNQGVWASQEIFIADLARVSNKELYIITGPAFTGPARFIKDEGKIRIPDFTWKIVVALDRGKGVADVRTWEDVAAMQVIVVKHAEHRRHPERQLARLPGQPWTASSG